MALFRGGPRSNITQVVSPMYQGIIQAEKQKGQAVREAMGAFGKAIDPKTIGMRKFKEEFANADWTNPETYKQASMFISEFDPSAAMQFGQMYGQMQPKSPKVDQEGFYTIEGQDKPVQAFSYETKGGLYYRNQKGDVVPLPEGSLPYEKTEPEKVNQEGLYTIKGQDKPVQTFSYETKGGLYYRNEKGDAVRLPEGSVPYEKTEPEKPSTLSTQVSEAFGFDAGTPEHRQEMQNLLARRGTVKNLPSAVQQISEMRKQVTSNPTYKAAMERRIKVETAQRLVPEVKAGNESAVPLLERTVSEIYNADTRAASEIDRLVKRKSWSTAFQDWLAGGFQGTLSNATIEDLDKMIEIMDQATAKSVNDIIDLENLLYKDIEGLDNAIVSRTLDRFRIVPEGEGTDFGDITQGRVRAANQPTQALEDGIYSDGSGGRLEVINGVAYEL